MKRPSFQFYPADWRNNAKLSRCSWGARGAWLEVMCLLHDSEEYGLLRWPLKDIAQAVGAPIKLLNELIAKGVLKGGDKGFDAFVYVPRSGRKDGAPVTLIQSGTECVWYSSRMVEDEYKRQNSGGVTRFLGEESKGRPTPKHSPSPRHGDNQGDDKGVGDGDEGGDNQGAAPSPRLGDGATSSSSSTSKNKEKATATATPPPIDVPVGNSPPVPVPSDPKSQEKPARNVQISVLIREWERARGKFSKVNSATPHIGVWVDRGVTDDQLREAYDLAVQDRSFRGEDTPVNAGFIDTFLAKLLNPPEGTSALCRVSAGSSRPWQATWSGIEVKAVELGVERVPGEIDPEFKARVFAAAQMTEQEKSALRADHGVSV